MTFAVIANQISFDEGPLAAPAVHGEEHDIGVAAPAVRGDQQD